MPRRERWPPPPAISSRGRWAGVTTGGCLVVAGLAFAVFSYDELTCRIAEGGCDVFVGVGGLISLLGLAVAAVGIVILRRVLIRPASPTGGSGWTSAWGVLFAIGGAVAVTRLPTLVCPDGFDLDQLFELCIRDGERFEATSHLLEKWLLVLTAVVFGVVLVKARRIPSAVATVLTVVAWVGGVGLLLVDTVAREFLPG